MPELPEVETVKRGLTQTILGQKITEIRLYRTHLRWEITPTLPIEAIGAEFLGVERRSKYLLLKTKVNPSNIKTNQDINHKYLLIHLGMSGRVRVLPSDTPRVKHDHVDIFLDNQTVIRYHDPRRFGMMLWIDDPENHPLIQKLGVEPLSEYFTPEYLFQKIQNKTQAIKLWLMDAANVVGVGNIYASESLFLAKILPTRAAASLSLVECQVLHQSIVQVLEAAIAAGGTTLRDYVGIEGKTGWFQVQLNVYGRKNLPCNLCENPIEQIIMGQRSTFFCRQCQK